MGAGIGKRLASHGVRVLTSLAGRSEATAARAREAGMVAANNEEIAAADFVLSILPPGDALALAQRFAPVLAASNAKPVYVDCNAINPATVVKVAGAIAPTGCAFVDAGIIGPPPKGDDAGPRLYASGTEAARFASLRQYGLDVRVLEGPLSAASALKMSYAGIVKGLAGIGSAMVVAATKAGAADALRDELALSQPAVVARLEVALPDMIPKAYRWVAEMREISGFLGPDHPASQIYEGFARWFEHLAADANGEAVDAALLKAFAARVAQKKA